MWMVMMMLIRDSCEEQKDKIIVLENQIKIEKENQITFSLVSSCLLKYSSPSTAAPQMTIHSTG